MAKKKSKKNAKKVEEIQTEQTEVDQKDPKVKEIDLSGLTLNDLIGLQNALPAIIEQARLCEKAILRERMIALAAESGFEISEVFDDSPEDISKEEKKRRKQIGFVKAKYLNPNKSEQTWSGRGRKPKWADEYIKQGGDLKDMLINSE